MNKSLFSFVLSLLQGASWALVILLSTFLFIHFLQYGFFIAIFGAFFGLLVGLSFVAFFELIDIEFKKLSLLEKQTKILEDIKDRLSLKNCN